MGETVMKPVLISIILVAFLCCIAVPAGAVVQEVMVKGSIATISQTTNTMTIENPLQYGCSAPSSGSVACFFKPMDKSSLTGTVPDAAAFTLFKTGDTVVATSVGGAGETWVTIAKVYGPRPNEEFVSSLVGDFSTIPSPFVGDYSLAASTTPDCSQCTGSTCTASLANVKVRSGATSVADKNLKPGESFTYNGRNDGSSITVTFVSGQASSDTCAGKSGVVGPQAISDYIVTVVPPIGYEQVDIRTATTTRPDEAITPITSATTGAGSTGVTDGTTPSPTKSGSLPVAAIGALGVLALAGSRLRR
jgi:hypothetical protein